MKCDELQFVGREERVKGGLTVKRGVAGLGGGIEVTSVKNILCGGREEGVCF